MKRDAMERLIAAGCPHDEPRCSNPACAKRQRKMRRRAAALLRERADAAVEAATSGLVCGYFTKAIPMIECTRKACVTRKSAIRAAVLGKRGGK